MLGSSCVLESALKRAARPFNRPRDDSQDKDKLAIGRLVVQMLKQMDGEGGTGKRVGA